MYLTVTLKKLRLYFYFSVAISMSVSEIQTKVKTYEDYIEDRLKFDLKAIEEVLKQKSKTCQEWQDIKNVVKHWKYLREKDRDTDLQIEIGSGVNAFAEVTEFNRLFIDIGAGVILEMDCEEAEKYANIRMNVLRKEIAHLRKLAVNVKVHIKLVLLAIYELQKS